MIVFASFFVFGFCQLFYPVCQLYRYLNKVILCYVKIDDTKMYIFRVWLDPSKNIETTEKLVLKYFEYKQLQLDNFGQFYERSLGCIQQVSTQHVKNVAAL